MSFAAYNSHSNEKFIDLGLVKVRDLISMNQLKLVYDFHNNHLPADLMSLFSLSSAVHTQSRELNSTVNRLLHIPAVKTTTYGLGSIKYHCAKLWNSMFKYGDIQVNDDKNNNIKVVAIKNKKSLNSILKRHFLYSYSTETDVVYYRF